MYVQVAIGQAADRDVGTPGTWRTAAACGDRGLADELRRVIEGGFLGLGGRVERILVRVITRDELVAEGGEGAIGAAAGDLDRLADGLWTSRRLLADDVVDEARLRVAATR